jgi:DNA-binding GntR family transcriptional regulator
MNKLLRAQPVEEQGLSNWALSRLRQAILDGRFEPGEKLDQALIASELGVSRTPLREAIKVLAMEGFLEIRSYRGVYISVITKEDVENIYEIRRIIESEIARQVTPLLSDAVLRHLETLLNKKGAQSATWNERWHYDIDQEFHGTLVGNCRNKLFKVILDGLNNRIVRVRSFALRQSGTHLELSHKEHLDILRALKKRDAEAAAKMVERHLRSSAKRIERYITQ